MRQQWGAVLSRDKKVEDPRLNRLGVQVARTAMARALWHARYASRQAAMRLTPGVDHFVRAVERDGLVEIPDFLPPEPFARACAEAEALLERSDVERQVQQRGGNLLEVVNVRRWAAPGGGIEAFFADPRLVATVQALERRPLTGKFGARTLERLTQVEGEPDSEASLHSDTFFTVHKAWLYLTDVTEQDGPLEYVPGSHRLSLTQLQHVYRESCGPNVGSRRIDAREVDARALRPRQLLCRRNTLVIANTMGYHRRAQGHTPGRRITLHLSVRANPFAAANFRRPQGNSTNARA